MPDSGDESGEIARNSLQSDLALARRADRQLALVSRTQLYELGFSTDQIRHRVAQGRLHPVFFGVYSVGHRRVDDQAKLLAALLSFGPDSFLSHRTAAAVYGLRAINTRNIEATLIGASRRQRNGLTLHRTATRPHPSEIRTRGLLRVSSVQRLLVELAPTENPNELERLITTAVQKRLLRLDAGDGRAALEATLARHSRRPGIAKLKAALVAYRRPHSSKSGLERAFDRLIAAHPEIPEPQRNVYIDKWEIDRFWPEAQLVVELDGRPYHLAARDMERDRRKDAALQRIGCTPIRVTDFRLEHEPTGVLDDVLYFLGLRPG